MLESCHHDGTMPCNEFPATWACTPPSQKPDKETLAVTRHHAPGVIAGQLVPAPPRLRPPPVVEFLACKRGDSGPRVKKLQRLLNEQAHSGLKVDGVFGRQTEDALAKFQRARGLPVMGTAGHQTLAALQSVAPPARPALQAVKPTGVSPGGPLRPANPTSSEDVHGWSRTRMLYEVYQRVTSRLPQEMRALWKQFATLETAEQTVGIIAAAILVQGVPVVGEVFDGLMFATLVWGVGMAAFEGGKELGLFLIAIAGASTEEDVNNAADHLAHAVVLLGIAAVMLWLHKRSTTSTRNASQAAENDAALDQTAKPRSRSPPPGKPKPDEAPAASAKEGPPPPPPPPPPPSPPDLNAQAKVDVGKVTAPIDFDGHILGAEIKPNGSVVGGHSIATGEVRVIPGSASLPNAQGVYQARIEVADPANPGQFLPKTNNGGSSTMFPDSWSADRVKVEVDAAYHNRTVTGNMWTGVTPSGVGVKGYLNPKTTVYPTY